MMTIDGKRSGSNVSSGGAMQCTPPNVVAQRR